MVRPVAPQRVDRLDLLAHEPVHPVELLLEVGIGPEVPRHGTPPFAGNDARREPSGSSVSQFPGRPRAGSAMCRRVTTELIDVPRLATWLADRLPAGGEPLRVARITAGASSELFRLERGRHVWVLRRPA